MSVTKNASTAAEPLRPAGQPTTEDNPYTSDAYQKVLDYHVAEILLSTIVLAIIALLGLHH
jgi:hypothetical protein